MKADVGYSHHELLALAKAFVAQEARSGVVCVASRFDNPHITSGHVAVFPHRIKVSATIYPRIIAEILS